MIELLPETKGRLIALKMSGTVTEEDQDRTFERAVAIFDAERVEHLLLDWEDLDGWAQGARSAGTWFGLHHRALIGRVAIIAEDKWAEEAMRIADIFQAVPVRRFLPAKRLDAFAWINEE
jgi:hypothetical protein